MRSNIDMTHGLVMSEEVMMGLGPYIGRDMRMTGYTTSAAMRSRSNAP